MTDIYGFENKKYDVIMFNMSSMYDWDHGIVNRNYHIMNTLTREEKINRIVAVDFFPVNARMAIKHYFKNILWEIKDAEMVYGDLTSACYRKSPKMYVYSSIDSLFSWKTVARELQRVEKILNLKNIVFWSYNPMFTEFIGRLNEKLFVFDAVDNWSEHNEYTHLMRKSKLLKNYQTIADKANLIFTVSPDLIGFFKTFGRTDNIFWIPNGVNYEHFNNQELIQQATLLDGYSQPIIGYLGTIESRLDLDLIAHLAQKHCDKIIALCGPIWQSVKKQLKNHAQKYKNIILTDRIPAKLAPAYLQRFSVGIIPHKINSFVQSMNPMKLYEYLAAGKPIVTTPIPTLEMFENKLYVAENYEQFSNAIDQALAQDNEILHTSRREEARRYSWHARVDEMIDQISLKLDWK